MLFHVTIGHEAQDCPGRRPTELTDLVAPSDTRDTLATQLNIKLHFVLWGAACMLWAQPEHLAFAVLEAEDVEAVMQYIGALVPHSWTYKVRPVWNLPSQLRLIRQVQLAPTMVAGGALTQPTPPPAEPAAEPAALEPQPSEAQAEEGPPPHVEQPVNGASATQSAAVAPDDADARTVPPASVSFPPGEAPESEDAADRAPVAELPDSGDPAAHRTWPRTEPDADSPGTITRLLEELESPPGTPERTSAEFGAEPALTSHPPSAEQATQIEQFVPPRAPRTRAWLVATNGPVTGSSFQLPLESATLGRLPENTIYIPDERLSREHARIDFRDGTFILTDLGSRNGTAVNGSLLSAPQPLSNGDIIELGSNTLVVNIETVASA